MDVQADEPKNSVMGEISHPEAENDVQGRDIVQEDAVSSKWMTELIEECLLLNANTTVTNLLLPNASAIEQSVKVCTLVLRCLTSNMLQ